MQVSELAKSVKEGNLTKDQLEAYYTELVSLFAEMEIRMGEIEKAEAIYLNIIEEPTRAGAERKWYATEMGQEQITLKHNIRAVEKLASSVKHRIYNTL